MTYPAYTQRLLKWGAFLVGSGAAGNTESDWDFIVPPDKWRTVAPRLPSSATPNKFGGWRFEVCGEEYDVWPDTLERYLKEAIRLKGTVHVIGAQFRLEATGDK